MNRAALLANVLFVAACSSDAGPPGRSPSQQRAAVASCRDAFRQASRLADVVGAPALLFEGCADMHAAPECADAWRQAARATPDRRIATAAAGCRAAYCPHLPAPKPTLCYGQFRDMTATELGHAWATFERVVLARDMGRAGAILVKGLDTLQPVVVAAPVVVPEPAPTAPPVTLSVAREGDALVVSRADAPDRRATLAGEASEDAGRVRPLVEGAGTVVVSTGSTLVYADVLRVMDALQSAGVTEVSIAAGPEPAP